MRAASQSSLSNIDAPESGRCITRIYPLLIFLSSSLSAVLGREKIFFTERSDREMDVVCDALSRRDKKHRDDMSAHGRRDDAGGGRGMVFVGRCGLQDASDASNEVPK